MARFTEFTLDEALEIARRNDPGEKVPSVSRVLIAEIERQRAEIHAGYEAGWYSLRIQRDNLQFELQMLEAMRLRDNAYLIERAEKAEAERNTWRAMYDDAMASGARLQRSAEALLQVAGMGGGE